MDLPQYATQHLDSLLHRAKGLPEIAPAGKLVRVVGLTLQAVGCRAPLGTLCHVKDAHGQTFQTQIIGFEDEIVYLMPLGALPPVQPGCDVMPTHQFPTFPVGPGLLGRVLDGAGHTLDGLQELSNVEYGTLAQPPINPLQRKPIAEVLDVGVKIINSLITVGRGQRLGLLAGSGVGKSTLLGMMTKFTEADVVVVGLVGERGREVQEFISDTLGPEGLAKSVIVASPANYPPVLRANAAVYATRIAESFREQGKNVLLLVDSLTRFAHAHRELSLAIGELPATKGYPSSVFSKIPDLIERAGNSASPNGTLTAFYTVLAEGDDQFDPVVDSARAILDGHIVLSREMSEAGFYPAVDVEGSISRAMNNIVPDSHHQLALQVRKLLALYHENKDLITMGAYVPGSDPDIDLAIRKAKVLLPFFQQTTHEKITYAETIQQLEQLVRQETDMQMISS